MKRYDEIKDIIVNKLGIKDLAAYKAYLDELYRPENPRIPSQEEIEQLSPDVIHNGEFWQVVEELFGIDCVANTNYGQFPQNEFLGNRQNLNLARSMGTLNMIDMWRHYSVDILEIGAGYGNFKNYCMINTAFNYFGIDCRPKTKGVIETPPNGLMPDSIKEKKFPVVYSSNVFQHFSTFQRKTYLKDIAGIIPEGGAFAFNIQLYTSKERQVLMPDGKAYLKHYGQFTEVPYYNDFLDDVYGAGFFVEFETRRVHDSLFGFLCRPKAKPPEVKVEVATEPKIIA